jgi:ribonuclease HIII
MAKTSYTFALTLPQQEAAAKHLREGNYRPLEVPYTRAAADGPDCKIMLYTSGKLVVQGQGAEDWVLFTLEPEILGQAKVGYEDVLDPSLVQPHMGVDESGKGDFFGPMVIAAAYVDPALADTFRKLNVRDSKRITTDRAALDLADAIAKALGDRFAIVAIGPAAYNKLYRTMGSVNRILAWGHARAIENLLDKVPGCPRALSDQFGPTRQIEQALLKKGRAIKLEQRTKAESDPAVAAASILARAGFLRALRTLGTRHGVELPKGASEQTRKAGVELVRKHGPVVLIETAKCHFRTTDQVLAEAGHARKELGPDGQAVSAAARAEAEGRPPPRYGRPKPS